MPTALPRVIKTPAVSSPSFDLTLSAPAHAQDGAWRAQRRLKSPSPRLHATSGSIRLGQGLAELEGKSDDEIVQALLDNDLNTATFVQYLQQHHGSPARLLPWLHTLSSLASKVGMLL